MSTPSNPTDFFTTFTFVVSIDNVPQGAFTEVTLPSLSLETETLKEGGQNAYVHKLPKNVDAGTLTLKRGITVGSVMIKWYNQVLEGKIKEAMRQVTITLKDSQGNDVATFSLTNAYPIKWRGPSLNTRDSAIAIEEIELAHQGFTMS
jgi:phage tail-like protein